MTHTLIDIIASSRGGAGAAEIVLTEAYIDAIAVTPSVLRGLALRRRSHAGP